MNDKKRLIAIGVIYIFLTSMLLIISCGGGAGNGGILTSMDIVDATTLFIIKSSSVQSLSLNSGPMSNGVQKLFKITEQGFIEEVKYYDEQGTETTIQYNQQPVAVYNVNNEYVIVCFGIGEESPFSGYLVRKSDGAVFTLEKAGFPVPMKQVYFNNAQSVYTDEDGDIYYHTYNFEQSEVWGEIMCVLIMN